MANEPTNIVVSLEDNVTQITLNRPDKYNAIDLAFHKELTAAFRQASDSPSVRAIVFASTGKVFSAGGDFDAILRDQADPISRHCSGRYARPLFMAFADCPLPIVTALQGDSVGLGTTLALCTDAVVAARTASISDPHVLIGLAAGDGGGIVWPQIAGILLAKRYLLSGDRIPAEAAHVMGLVTDLVDTSDQVLPAARALAKRIAALPPRAVQATKRMLSHGLRHRIEETFDLGFALELETMATGDVVEAIAAFREKRIPTYRGT
jgi:enoyl-CoA hydratase